MSTSYNPLNVMMGQPSKVGMPYIGGNNSGGKKPLSPSQGWNFGLGDAPPMSGGSVGLPGTPMTSGSPPQQPIGPSNLLGAESVRATGAGPFDSAYRQDLATFAGGLFNRPGGNLSFNPTSPEGFGQPVGGGNAPLTGMPNTLLQNALGGNPFNYTPPQPATGTDKSQSMLFSMQDWLNEFLKNGRGFRGANG
jgi:hypothetical protein